jgi:hypothetical protein
VLRAKIEIALCIRGRVREQILGGNGPSNKPCDESVPAPCQATRGARKYGCCRHAGNPRLWDSAPEQLTGAWRPYENMTRRLRSGARYRCSYPGRCKAKPQPVRISRGSGAAKIHVFRWFLIRSPSSTADATADQAAAITPNDAGGDAESGEQFLRTRRCSTCSNRDARYRNSHRRRTPPQFLRATRRITEDRTLSLAVRTSFTGH